MLSVGYSELFELIERGDKLYFNLSINYLIGEKKIMFSKTFFSIVQRLKPITSFARLSFPQYRPAFYFTSSSDPTQVALLEEVEAKVFQVLKSAAKCNQSKLSRTASF